MKPLPEPLRPSVARSGVHSPTADAVFKIVKELLGCGRKIEFCYRILEIIPDLLYRLDGRSLLEAYENGSHMPSLSQLEDLMEVLDFDFDEIRENAKQEKKDTKIISRKIAVAGTGYVGMSIAVLLAQHSRVRAVDIIEEKVRLINERKSPIQDDFLEDYLANKDLDLEATLDAEYAYSDAD